MPIFNREDRLTTPVRHIALLLLVSVAAAGCVHRLVTQGKMINGRIQPCAGNHMDPQACGNALHNAPLLSELKLGQTKEEVLVIMKHEAERHEAQVVDGKAVEVWAYMQDYGSERMTAVVFADDGVVTGIRTVPWKSDLGLIEQAVQR